MKSNRQYEFKEATVKYSKEYLQLLEDIKIGNIFIEENENVYWNNEIPYYKLNEKSIDLTPIINNMMKDYVGVVSIRPNRLLKLNSIVEEYKKVEEINGMYPIKYIMDPSGEEVLLISGFNRIGLNVIPFKCNIDDENSFDFSFANISISRDVTVNYSENIFSMNPNNLKEMKEYALSTSELNRLKSLWGKDNKYDVDIYSLDRNQIIADNVTSIEYFEFDDMKIYPCSVFIDDDGKRAFMTPIDEEIIVLESPMT